MHRPPWDPIHPNLFLSRLICVVSNLMRLQIADGNLTPFTFCAIIKMPETFLVSLIFIKNENDALMWSPFKHRCTLSRIDRCAVMETVRCTGLNSMSALLFLTVLHYRHITSRWSHLAVLFDIRVCLQGMYDTRKWWSISLVYTAVYFKGVTLDFKALKSELL